MSPARMALVGGRAPGSAAAAGATPPRSPPCAAETYRPAEQPPFGGRRCRPCVEPGPGRATPPGFELTRGEAITIADRTEAVREERAERRGDAAAAPSPRARPLAGKLLRPATADGGRPGSRSTTAPATVLEAWRDHQVGAKLARGYEGAVGAGGQLALDLDRRSACSSSRRSSTRRRPLRLLHLDLLVIVGLSVSLFFFNRGEITASVAAHLSGARLRLRSHAARRAAPRAATPARWSRGRRCAGWRSPPSLLACARIALNVADSQRDRHRRRRGRRRRPDRRRRGALRGRLRARARPPRRRLRAAQLPRLRPVRGGLPVGGRVGRRARRPRRGDRLRPAHRARAARARAAGCGPAPRGGRSGSRSRSPGWPAPGRSTR